MTVASELKRSSSAGTGSTKTFFFNGPVKGVDDLKVYTVAVTSGTVTTQSRGGSGTYDYAVAINSSTEFATITLNNNLPNNDRIVIVRNITNTQEVDYVEGDPFSASTHEGALDKLTLINTQIAERVDRAIKLPVTTALGADALTWPYAETASDQANKQIAYNAAGTALVTTDAAISSVSATTLGAGSSATVSYTPTTGVLALGIPTGATGETGPPSVFSAIASKAEAEAGTDNTKGMSPLRTKEAITINQGAVSNAAFYGFKKTGNILQVDVTTGGGSESFTLSDYDDTITAATGLTFSTSGVNLIMTTP